MKTLKNVNVVFLKGDDGVITVSICDGDEFYDLTFLEENCEYSYEKGIGEKFSFTDFDTFDEFYNFLERNHENKMTYNECMEKYFPRKEEVRISNYMEEIANLTEEEVEILSENLKKVIKRNPNAMERILRR